MPPFAMAGDPPKQHRRTLHRGRDGRRARDHQLQPPRRRPHRRIRAGKPINGRCSRRTRYPLVRRSQSNDPATPLVPHPARAHVILPAWRRHRVAPYRDEPRIKLECRSSSPGATWPVGDLTRRAPILPVPGSVQGLVFRRR